MMTKGLQYPRFIFSSFLTTDRHVYRCIVSTSICFHCKCDKHRLTPVYQFPSKLTLHIICTYHKFSTRSCASSFKSMFERLIYACKEKEVFVYARQTAAKAGLRLSCDCWSVFLNNTGLMHCITLSLTCGGPLLRAYIFNNLKCS